MKKKIGKIDLLKFLSALFIIILHIKWRPKIGTLFGYEIVLGCNGVYAVVFFFIISGALFSVSAYNKRNEWNNRTELDVAAADTRNYILRKYKGFIKWYLVGFSLYVINSVLFYYYSLKQVITELFYSIPSILLLGHVGFDNKEVYPFGYTVGPSWYLSSLLIMFCFFYPIIRINYSVFTKIISPLLFIGCLYLNISIYNSSIVGSKFYSVIPFLFGVIIGDISCSFSDFKSRKIYPLIEISCYILYFSYINLANPMNKMSEYPVMIVAGIGVLITLANFSESKIFNNSVIYYLGSVSLPLFLVHIPISFLYEGLFLKINPLIDVNIKSIIIIVSSVLFSVAVYEIDMIIRKKRHGSDH